MSEALTQQRSFNAIALDGPFKIDFFIRGDRLFSREEFRRARPLQVESPERVTVRLKSPEDLILRKVEGLQLGGAVSGPQWRGAPGVRGARRGRWADG